LGQPVRQASALVREGGTCNRVKRKKGKKPVLVVKHVKI